MVARGATATADTGLVAMSQSKPSGAAIRRSRVWGLNPNYCGSGGVE